ncbi:MAG: helix-hairpin-helix domain-containing protein, partial [Niameybacter sp.]
CTRGDYVIKLLNKYKIIFVLILLSMTSLLLIKKQNETDNIQILEQPKVEIEEVQPVIDENWNDVEVRQLIPVYICGAVYKPDVYQVEETSILKDVLNLAGGVTPEADVTQINLAKAIQANEKIVVPKVGEEIDKISDSYENEERVQAASLININKATVQELTTLPGIGEVKAGQIVLYREQKGNFESKEMLKDVSGIGDKLYNGLEQCITVE